MKKLKSISEEDFSRYEARYEDFHYKLAENISKLVNTEFPIIAEKTGMKLFVHAKDPNLKKFRGGNYRIIIEKLN